MKAIKLIGFFIISCFLFLENVWALSGSVRFDCPNTTIPNGESITCTLVGTADEEVSGISAKLVEGDSLELSECDSDSSWQGDANNGKIVLYTDTGKSGSFTIATFTINPIDEKAEKGVVRVEDITFVGSDFQEVSIDSQEIEFVIESSSPKFLIYGIIGGLLVIIIIVIVVVLKKKKK